MLEHTTKHTFEPVCLKRTTETEVQGRDAKITVGRPTTNMSRCCIRGKVSHKIITWSRPVQVFASLLYCPAAHVHVPSVVPEQPAKVPPVHAVTVQAAQQRAHTGCAEGTGKDSHATSAAISEKKEHKIQRPTSEGIRRTNTGRKIKKHSASRSAREC